MKDKTAFHAKEPASTKTGCETHPTPRILVVDDDGEILRFSATMLARSSYQVDAAADGAAVELIKKLHSAHMALPVILASGAMPEDDFNLQLAATLQKPFTVDALLGTVQEVLRVTVSPHEQMEPPPIGQSQPPDDDFRL